LTYDLTFELDRDRQSCGYNRVMFYYDATPAVVEQWRVRVLIPRPHVLEHSDHGDHAAQPASPGGDTVDRCPPMTRLCSTSALRVRWNVYISCIRQHSTALN